MALSRTTVARLALAALVVLAGCGELVGGSETTEDLGTTTPAPVPSVATEADTAGPDRADTSGYASLWPTCTRPPAVVIYLQVAALANNDPATDDGIETAWRFVAPSMRAYTGPYENFRDGVEQFYGPLLAAERIRYGPLDRGGGSVTRQVTVGADNETTTYEWTVERQTEPPHEGCWMTTGIGQRPVNSTGDGR